MTDGNPPNDRGCRACGKIGVSSSVKIILNNTYSSIIIRFIAAYELVFK